MKKTTALIALAVVLAVACSKKPENAAPTAAATSGTSPAADAAGTKASSPAPQPGGENLLGLASGAIVVQRPAAPEGLAEAWYMFDEDPRTGWTSEAGKFNQLTVVELADRSVIHTLQFDDASDEYDGRAPKEVLVEMSDTSATDGFKPIAGVTLSPELKDGQSFPASTEVPGRWVRITIKSMHTTNEIAQIMEVRAFGDRLTHNPPPNVSGTYETDAGLFHLKQEGTTVTGCYEHGTKPLQGGMEGRLMRFTWNTETDTGPSIAIFGNNGSMFVGWWKANSAVVEHPVMEAFQGKKKSDQVGDCPQWKAPNDQMASEIKQSGRVRLYGINFDSDSDVIRSESKPTIDQVAAMLKANPDLRVAIEGHTDSTSTPEHNQQLSEKRAGAVMQALVTAGVDASRLNAVGYGATRPVATNATPLGRAANRRVELARL
jgi:outer membrane protein OmpA-like peptidoglycan-associated protein